MAFSKYLIKWYLQNHRDLPWRHTKDPYLIWLSEIILQQTRVAQGMSYYMAFVEAFPNVLSLARASEEEVLKLWQGLGYYSRARNLHATARFIASELEGNFPTRYQELLKLKGVGDYTASAISSFAFDEPQPVVDGNVFRVLARYFAIDTDISTPAARIQFKDLAAELMQGCSPSLFNQAIMEFGALQCTPAKPDCGVCPLNRSCLALAGNLVSSLPVKKKKQKPRNRYFHYLVVTDENGHTILRKRSEKDIWHNLYEFPLIESESLVSLSDLGMQDVLRDMQILSVSGDPVSRVLHKLTHQHLDISFWKVTVKGRVSNGIDKEVLRSLPVPVVIHNFIESEF